jgi:hypothetical protein
MVRKIKIVDVYSKPEASEEETIEPPPPAPSGEATNAQTSDTEPTIEPMIEASESEHEPPEPSEPKNEEVEEEPAKKPKNKILDMPTTPKILQQVECQACGRKMSAKVLKYSHAKYCTAREKQEQPETIPIPKLEIKNGEHLKERTSLPVKNLKLKRSKPFKLEDAEKVATPQPLPPQTLEMDQSFHYKMKQKNQQREEKYQIMMSNAF